MDSDERASLAGWKPHPTFAPENLIIRYQYPRLSMRIWAELDGVHLYAITELPADDRGIGTHHVIAQAVWQPAEVTERAVVDWGHRALRKWLEDALSGG